MKRGTKIALLTAGLLLVLGVGLMLGGMGGFGFDFGSLGTAERVTRTEEITEPFTEIVLNGAECRTVLQPSADGRCRVVLTGEPELLFRASAENGTLTVTAEDGRKWFEKVRIGFTENELTLCLPEGQYGALTAEMTSGSLEIPGEFSFSGLSARGTSGEMKLAASAGTVSVRTTSGSISADGVEAQELEAESTSGSVRLADVTVSERLTVKTSSGAIVLEKGSARELSVSATSGSVRLCEVSAAERLTAEATSGSIRLEGAAAEEIRITATSGSVRLNREEARLTEISVTSGSVTGTVSGPRLFDVHTASGSASVPESGGDRIFRVSTTSGSVRISYGN